MQSSPARVANFSARENGYVFHTALRVHGLEGSRKNSGGMEKADGYRLIPDLLNDLDVFQRIADYLFK